MVIILSVTLSFKTQGIGKCTCGSKCCIFHHLIWLTSTTKPYRKEDAIELDWQSFIYIFFFFFFLPPFIPSAEIVIADLLFEQHWLITIYSISEFYFCITIQSFWSVPATGSVLSLSEFGFCLFTAIRLWLWVMNKA